MAETAAQKKQREWLEDYMAGVDRELQSYAQRLEKVEELYRKLREAIITRGGFPVD